MNLESVGMKEKITKKNSSICILSLPAALLLLEFFNTFISSIVILLFKDFERIEKGCIGNEWVKGEH